MLGAASGLTVQPMAFGPSALLGFQGFSWTAIVGYYPVDSFTQALSRLEADSVSQASISKRLPAVITTSLVVIRRQSLAHPSSRKPDSGVLEFLIRRVPS